VIFGSSLIGLYPSDSPVKNCGDLITQYEAGLTHDAVYRGASYQDMMIGYSGGEYGRMMLGCHGDEDATRMRHDVIDYRCYYDNRATAPGAWYVTALPCRLRLCRI